MSDSVVSPQEITEHLERFLPHEVLEYLEPEQKRLIHDSLVLIAYFEDKPLEPNEIHDYAFVVFPLAKAFEGFLKTYFYRKNLITEKVYSGRHFRVGRSFNPDLPDKYRDEFWVYDDVARECGEDLARRMWNVWLDARNHLFHYFPNDKYDVTLAQAKELVFHTLDVVTDAIHCEGPGPYAYKNSFSSCDSCDTISCTSNRTFPNSNHNV